MWIPFGIDSKSSSHSIFCSVKNDPVVVEFSSLFLALNLLIYYFSCKIQIHLFITQYFLGGD